MDVAAQALAPQDDAPETTAPAMQTHELAPEPGTDLHGDAGGREARARRLPLLVIGAGLTLTLLFGLYWAITTSGPGPANPSPLKPIGRPAAAEAPPDKPPAAAVAPRVPARPVEEIFVEETVTQAGKPTVVKRPASVVKLVTRPEVTVYLGNKELGRTPLVVTLPEGPAQLRFEDKKLGLSKQVTYLAVAHQRTTEVIEFSQGWLDVQAPIFAKVIIDGAAAGTVPLQSVALYEGQHRVEVELASGERSARIVTISAGLTVTEEFSAPDQNRK